MRHFGIILNCHEFPKEFYKSQIRENVFRDLCCFSKWAHELTIVLDPYRLTLSFFEYNFILSPDFRGVQACIIAEQILIKVYTLSLVYFTVVVSCFLLFFSCLQNLA